MHAERCDPYSSCPSYFPVGVVGGFPFFVFSYPTCNYGIYVASDAQLVDKNTLAAAGDRAGWQLRSL